jgi:uncharacterized cupredoxin-like copper-binding protein
MTKKTIVMVGVLAAVLFLGVGMAFGMGRMDRTAWGQGQMMSGGLMVNGSHAMQGGQWSGSAPAPTAIAGARELTVTAKDLTFSPTTLSAKPGEAVNVVFRNADEMVHDFTVPMLGIHVAAQPGETVTFGMRITSAGSYEFWCSVPGHAAAGMRGTIMASS